MTTEKAEPTRRDSDLDARQSVVIDWGIRAFGADHMADKIVRAARFFEEAAEMVQAVGLPRDHAKRAFDHVYSREPGDPKQEAGGSVNTLMALCGAIGLSLDECQRFEIERCLAKDPAHFAKRNETKLREVDAVPARDAQGDSECVTVTIIARGDNENTPAEAVHHGLEYARKAGFIEMWTDTETKPAQEDDHQKRPFAFAVRRAPENGPDEWRLFRNEGDAREAAEQLDGDYEGLYRVGDRRSAIRALSETKPAQGNARSEEITDEQLARDCIMNIAVPLLALVLIVIVMAIGGLR